MKKIFKTVAALATAATLTMSLAGCGLVVDKAEIDRVNEERALAAEREKQGKEIVLTINDNIEVTGAYYGYYFSTVQNEMYAAEQQAQEATATSDAEGTSAAEIKLDQEAVKAEAKNRVAEVKMAYEKAKEAGITLTDADRENINANIDSMRSQVSQTGLSFSDYLTLMYTDQATVEQVFEESYMASLYNASLVKDKFVTAKHILVQYDNETTTKEDAKKSAEDIKAKLDAGEDFDKLMNEKSEDGRDEAGNLMNPDGYTFTNDGSMVPEFEAAAFALAEGAVSDIINVESEGYNGFHILKKMPTSLGGIAEALAQVSDAEIISVIDAATAALTEGINIVEGEKISYYTVE